jgi:hypothetical protein
VIDQLGVLKLVTERLDTAGIAYMITGSIAFGHYAQPRMTRDIDLVVDLEPADAERLTQIFGKEFECDADRIRTAIARRSMFNLIHTDAIVKVDFMVRKDSPYRMEEFARRQHVVVDGHPMWFVTAEDLLLSKLVWARESRSEIQLGDIHQLLTTRADLDWQYIDRWADTLGVSELLKEQRQ